MMLNDTVILLCLSLTMLRRIDFTSHILYCTRFARASD